MSVESGEVNYIKTDCPHCEGSIEFPEHGAGEKVDCPHCGKEIVLLNPSSLRLIPTNTREFYVVEMRFFITLTDQESRHEFRILSSDAILLVLKASNWRTGDVVKLSEQQQKTLTELDARCREMGDEAAIRETKLQNKLGCLSWTVVIVGVTTLIALHNKLGWWTWILIIAVVIHPIVFLLIASRLKNSVQSSDAKPREKGLPIISPPKP